MHLIRLILILMISVSLPFSNVAASAMLHCVQPTNASPVTPSAHSQHTGQHAEHHVLQDEAAADDGEPVLSSQSDLSCSSCSYCQSCASAMAPAVAAQSFKIDVSSAIKSPADDPLRQSTLEGPFRPPALAFA